MEYGNSFYNAIFIAFLVLLVLFIMLYFMGWLEGIGLKNEPSLPEHPKQPGG